MTSLRELLFRDNLHGWCQYSIRERNEIHRHYNQILDSIYNDQMAEFQCLVSKNLSILEYNTKIENMMERYDRLIVVCHRHRMNDLIRYD